jgi:nitrite reductase/ring-hydroxylating ferredoxin subunit
MTVLGPVARGSCAAVTVDGEEFVVWRGAGGALGSAPRWCPHLDWDLAEARVVGDELVCPGHGWSFTVTGRACKRNERGRLDDKGAIRTLVLHDAGDAVAVGVGGVADAAEGPQRAVRGVPPGGTAG